MIPVRIDSSRPIFIESDAASFAEVFAHANSEEQAEILRLALGKINDAFPLQLDQIALELEAEKYAKTREILAYLATEFSAVS